MIPERLKLPEGCNFACWVERACSTEELARVFELSGWHLYPTGGGYKLTKSQRFTHWRGKVYSYQKTLLLEGVSPLHVLCGQIEYPSSEDREIRQLLWSRWRCNTLVCQWHDDAGRLWREVPASPELLGLNPDSLVDADVAAIATGSVRKQVGGPVLPEQSSFSETSFLIESVVVDDSGIRHYDVSGIRQLERSQIREVAAESSIEGPESCCWEVYRAAIAGDAGWLFISRGCEGFSQLLDGLASLPNFPRGEFLAALKRVSYDEKVVVWQRP